MKKNEIEIPEGKTVKCVNGILTLVDEVVKDNRPIIERVKNFQDAIKELGEQHPLVQEYEMLQGMDCSPQSPDLLAYLKLRIITAALNEGWKPQFTKGERRWYCLSDLITKEQYDKLSAEDKSRVVYRSSSNALSYGGVSYLIAINDSSYTNTSIGSRLAFKNEKLAAYSGRQFAEIYADFCFKPNEEETKG